MKPEKPRFPRIGEEDWAERLQRRIEYGERRLRMALVLGVASGVAASAALNLLLRWLG